MTLRPILSRLVALMKPPPGWTAAAIWAPPLVIPAASPIWREAAIEAAAGLPPEPEAEPAPARLRLVHSALKEA
jgi:hypothetical protein